MALKQIKQIIGKGLYLTGDDIDTDRIIPARFMKCVTFDGLGQYAFYDVRFDEQDKPKDHPMNKPEFKDSSVLLSGKNFGCGSSREHAPQALYHWGIRAVVAESFAEIFFGNCTTLGIPCVVLSKAEINQIAQNITKNPEQQITIDLQTQTLSSGALSLKFNIPEGARDALMQGQWDSLGQLLESKNEVKALSESLKAVF
ncbi:MAG: 3-isopropylmalate dehydratase small subunit [Candidatus Caenarcaniphilales bacterium]|nr:3-isopropylmalate dehydratase small subunit [Candidatus Caenarcaniphilales bacterium]